jgi:hypothetical protein
MASDYENAHIIINGKRIMELRWKESDELKLKISINKLN